MATTAEELADDLDGSLAWRRHELHALKSELDGIPAVERESPRARGLRRAALAMLYAHWEGYVKEACQGYLDLVARRRLKYAELNDAFVMLGARRVTTAASNGDPAASSSMIELIRRGPEVRAALPRTGIVNTRSNLRHEVLVEIMTSLGLPHDEFTLRANLIDLSLCDARNDIAHGRSSCPTTEQFVELFHEVLDMMVRVQTIVVNAAASGAYRAPAPVTAATSP